MKKNPIFIAEIKTQSMFGFKARYHRETLINTAIRYGDWVSVHTDPRFGGSFDDIYQIRKLTSKPILAKGFHSHNNDVKKAFDLGADYVLVVDRPNRYLLDRYIGKILFEFSNSHILDEISYDFLEFGKIVFNGRNLNTGIGKKSIAQYHEFRKKCKWLCGASLLSHPNDVKMFYPNCDAFIVGESLFEFCKELKK